MIVKRPLSASPAESLCTRCNLISWILHKFHRDNESTDFSFDPMAPQTVQRTPNHLWADNKYSHGP